MRRTKTEMEDAQVQALLFETSASETESSDPDEGAETVGESGSTDEEDPPLIIVTDESEGLSDISEDLLLENVSEVEEYSDSDYIPEEGEIFDSDE